jgi:hypothetical protein
MLPLEIESNGSDDLTITNIDLTTGTEFSVNKIEDGNGNPVNLPALVPIGDKLIANIKFDPTAKTTYNDTLTIVHDATNHVSPLDISLSGEGRDPIVKTFDVVTKAIEHWVVPAGVTKMNIQIWGAGGGGTGYGTPGKGARMQGDFDVSPGDILDIAVGEQGQTGGQGGGGGGGTFVASNSQPLIIAGGGGGSHYYSQGLVGKDGVTTQTCTPYSPTGSGHKSGSGGSWSRDGANGDYGATGGKGWNSGLTGGVYAGYLGHWSNGNGGFGGGGGGSWAPGSAGGYNGGVSPDCGGNQTPGGTGGGSINNGTNQSNTAGVQVGNGKVIITY